jgi:hypothetical protein
MNDFDTGSDFSADPPDLSDGQPVYQRTLDEDQPLASAITQAATESSGLTHDELPPLYETVDVEQLESLLASMPDGESCAVSFCYCEYIVEIRCAGKITLW